MRQTVQNLKAIAQNTAMELEDIAVNYQQNQDPVLFATAFVKMHKTALNVWKTRYAMFDEHDVVSWSLELTDKALMTYTPGKAKVNTYFYTLMFNHMRMEYQQLNTHKRKAVFCSSSFDKMLEEGFDIEADLENNTELKMTLETLELSQKELDYCLMTADNYSNKMIAEKLEVSLMTISNIKKKLQAKINPSALIC